MSGISKINYTAILGTTTIPISDIRIIEKLNQISSFRVIIANTTDNRTIISANIGSTLYIYRDDILVFSGRIDVDKIRYTQIEIILSGYAAYIDLHFEFFNKDQGQYDIRRVQFDNIAANTILGYVLTGTSYSVSECPTTLISLRGEYESQLQWISAIAKACKYVTGGNTYSCDWWIDSTDAVHIKQSKGSAKGTPNLTESLQRELDYANIQNTAYGLGYGDGINQLQTVKSNTASVTAYSAREISKIDRRFQKQASLDNEMQEHADAHAEPVETVPCEISTWDWYDLDLETGDTVTLKDEITGIDGSYRIKKANIGAAYTQLDITNIVPRLTSEIQAIFRQLHIDGGYMQGATNIWQTSHGKNVSNAVPIKLKIFIPSDAVYINSVKLSYAVLDFEKYTGVTAGGSAHTHDIDIDAISGGNDIGWIGVQTIGAENKFVAGQNVSNIKSNNTEASHNHTVNPNLSTTAADCNDIAVAIDTTDKTAELEAIYGTLSTVEDSDLEIKDYLSNPAAGNWHTVTITPNGTGSPTGMCYIMAHLSIQVFIQSD